GLTYLGGARARTREHAALYGRARTALVGLAGAMVAVSVVVGAHVADNRLVAARLSQLDGKAPETRRAALQALHAYPLCGRTRCRQLVCSRLVREFPTSQTDSGGPFVPPEIDDAFQQVYGVSVAVACGTA